MHSPGVQKGVHECGFLGGSRCARNPVVAPFQFRPATKIERSTRWPFGTTGSP